LGINYAVCVEERGTKGEEKKKRMYTELLRREKLGQKGRTEFTLQPRGKPLKVKKGTVLTEGADSTWGVSWPPE